MIKLATMVKVAAPVLVAGAVTGGVLVAVDNDERAAPATRVRVIAEPAAWFDDPLDGSILAPGAVKIVAHAGDRGRIAALELRVNGEQVDERAPERLGPDGDTLAWATFSWTPTEPGRHRLSVRGKSRAGEYGKPGDIDVFVPEVPGGPPLERAAPPAAAVSGGAGGVTLLAVPLQQPPGTPVATPGSTSSAGTTTTAPAGGSPAATTPPRQPTTTRRPATTSTTECRLSAPAPTKPADDGSVPGDRVTFEWTYPSCDPDFFSVEVSRADSFERIEQAGDVDGSLRSWAAPNPLTCITYYWRVRAVVLDTAGPWSDVFSFTACAASDIGAR